MMPDKIYEQWVQNAIADKELQEELDSIKNSEEDIADRFFKELSFGTGGLRGVIGAGTNRMNIYTVKKATQGLALYLNAEFENPGVAIAYDSRKNSEIFAKAAAGVFCANGVKVHIYEELMPTPMLSFAVRELKLSAGIVVTASHNPAKYNGYKVYGNDGCQITLDAASKITGYIGKVDVFSDVKDADFQEGLANGAIKYIGNDVIDRYFEEVYKCSVYDKAGNAGLKVVYSPLNGSGNRPVRRILEKIGIKDISIVKEQEMPDPEFKTCPFPNPEEKEALALGIKQAEENSADIVLATDPDCDRVGTAVLHKGSYVLINGNEMGVLLLDFVCRMRKENGTMPVSPVAIKTIVTTEMARAIANEYGVELKDVLTGFKFIGEQIGLLEKEGREERFIFGFEESYGYLSGAYVRDKDAVDASMLISEMAAYYKTQGKTLIDAIDALYEKYGYYYDVLKSFEYEGAAGMDEMDSIMKNLRQDPPGEIAGLKVISVCDYLNSIKYSDGRKEKIKLPSSDVIGLELTGGSKITVRPSGTEPKLKVYYSLKCENRKSGAQTYSAVSKKMQELLK